MKKIHLLVLGIFLISSFADAQITYKGGLDQAYKLLIKGIAASNSWSDSAKYASRLYLVQLTIASDGTTSNCNILTTGQSDSAEIGSIFRTYKKLEAGWLNATGKPGIVLSPIFIIKRDESSDEGFDNAMQQKYADFKMTSFATWQSVAPLILLPVNIIVGHTVDKNGNKITGTSN